VKPEELSASALAIIQGEARLALSIISIWEIAQLTANGKIQLPLPLKEWFDKACPPGLIEVLPLHNVRNLSTAGLPGSLSR
jgi:PIN domain nuclease of toxin-antitoxin system